jgi:hypothetical protein
VVANSNNGTTDNPTNNVWAAQPDLLQYTAAADIAGNMNAAAIGNTGGNQPHNNMIPYQVVKFIIATDGVYPARN